MVYCEEWPLTMSLNRYFEARNNPSEAPLTIYLAGGPCFVADDSNSTYNNEWSLNTNLNVLYIDQPVGSGYSYSSLINATWDLLFTTPQSTEDTGIIAFDEYNGSIPEANTTFLYGTMPSQDPLQTPNSTVLAARTLWHFSQAWFSSFPEYKTCNKKVNMIGNSYAGFWIPATASHVVAQNEKIRQGQLNNSIVIDIDTISITNGCCDQLYEIGGYPQAAYNNTYGLQAINETQYETALAAWDQPGACRDQILQCRQLGELYDPEQVNINATVGQLCTQALDFCWSEVLDLYASSNRSAFDMAHLNPDPYPPYYGAYFLNRAWVQQALGVPLNFTPDSTLVTTVVTQIGGDIVRNPGTDRLAYLLDHGVKVSLVHGDRDYRCPWQNAENMLMSVNWTGAEAFREAGYELIQTNGTYDGGVVKQHGNLSFERVFDSGHDAAAYQPETVFRIFDRAIFNHDIATGRADTSGNCSYTTQGPLSAFGWKNTLPPSPPPACYLYSIAPSCTPNQYEALANGSAVVKNGFILSPSE